MNNGNLIIQETDGDINISKNTVSGVSTDGEGCGGGIYIEDAQSVEIYSGTFSENQATGLGGGIYSHNSLELICPNGKTLTFSGNSNDAADSSKDIYALNGIIIGGKVNFDQTGSVYLAEPPAYKAIQIKSTLNGVTHQIPLNIPNDAGWEIGTQVIALNSTHDAGLNLAEEVAHFKLVSGSLGSGFDSEGKLQ